jgi:hypothetical protein
MSKNATCGAIPADNKWERLARRYLRFAREEARDACPIYAALAEAVASSPDLLAFLAELPEDKCQPDLFLAAVRHLDGVPRDSARLGEIVQRGREPLRALILSRSTQTNEPARCAVLLPALACLPQPSALIAGGASAGLCLYPDSYRYDYGGHRLGPPANSGTHRSSPAPSMARCLCQGCRRAWCGVPASTSTRSTSGVTRMSPGSKT